MADKKNTEAPAAEPAPASIDTTAAPVAVVKEKRGWAMPLIAALVVVVALVVGGIGGFAIARATDGGPGRPAMQQGQLPGGPGGPQNGGQQGPGQQGPGTPQDHGTQQGDGQQDTDDTDD